MRQSAFTGFIGVLAGALLLAGPAAAQAPAGALGLEAALLDPALRPADLPQLAWLPGTAHDFTYVQPAVGRQPATLVRGSATTQQLTPLVTLPALAEALHAAGAARPDTFPPLHWQNLRTLLLTNRGDTVVYAYDLPTGRARRLFSRPAYDWALDAPHARLAYALPLRTQEIVTPNVDMPGYQRQTVELDTVFTPRYVAGVLQVPAAYAVQWSPGGQHLLYREYRLHNRDSSRPARYGLYRLGSRRTVWLPELLRRPQGRAVSVTFSPDEASLYVAATNREEPEIASELALQQYNTATGQLQRTLFVEPAPALGPLGGPYFVPGQPWLVWQSTRDGHPHLYLYTTGGQLLRQLTHGNFLVTEVLGFSAGGREVVYASTAAGPLERQLYAQPLAGGAPRRLTPEPGTHLGALSPDGQYLLTRFSSPTEPQLVRVLRVATGRPVRTLLRSANPLAAYRLGTTRLVPIGVAGGKDTLYGRLLLPPGPDPARRYPLLVETGNGPPTLHIGSSWQHGADPRLHFLAQQGYAVLSVEGLTYVDRGPTLAAPTHQESWYRPRWHAAPNVWTSDNGTTEYLEEADLAAVLRYAKALPGIDSSRVGLLGEQQAAILVRDFRGARRVSVMVHANGTGTPPPPGGRMLNITYSPHETELTAPASAQAGAVDYVYLPVHLAPSPADRLAVFRLVWQYVAAHL